MIDFLAKYYGENDFDLHFEIPDLGADLYTNKNRIDVEHDFRNIKKIGMLIRADFLRTQRPLLMIQF